MTDLRRPPSRAGKPSSPRLPLSRPGSAMSNLGSSSRPMTPGTKNEPYTGSITVSIRPNPYSVNPVTPSPWEIYDTTSTIMNNTDMSSYHFDNVFSADTSITNKDVYDKVCNKLVNRFLLEGFNATVFAYGMTGSGKTFSMRGDNADTGFVTLAIDSIFNKIEQLSMDKQYKLSVTYLEIYNEKIIDLLSTTNSNLELKIRDDPVFGTKIIGISEPNITSKEQLLLLIRKGDNNRKTSATDFNTRSSRSHSILQIRLTTINLHDSTEQHATLSLCDLAGSERATSSLERRKEGAYINKSLLALSTVINKLSLASSTIGGAAIMDHIPYRDSKLTRLLQPALSGSSLILILCTIHLGSITNNPQSVSETLNTLRFAARAKDIVMNVQKNKASSFGDAESIKVIEELKRTIESQKNELLMMKMNPSSSFSHHDQFEDSNIVEKSMKIAQIESENRILNERLEHFTRLTDLHKTETIILKNDTLNDILGSGVDSLQIMMGNLEQFYKRVDHEMEEQKSYIQHLETQLKLSQQENTLNAKAPVVDKQTDLLLQDQEEEILRLKELITDKDLLINGLTKTSKLRRFVDANSFNSKVNVDSGPRTSSGDKENDFGDLRQFKIAQKKELDGSF